MLSIHFLSEDNIVYDVPNEYAKVIEIRALIMTDTEIVFDISSRGMSCYVRRVRNNYTGV